MLVDVVGEEGQGVQDDGAVAAGEFGEQGRHAVTADRGARQTGGGLDRGRVADQQTGDGEEFVRAARYRLAAGMPGARRRHHRATGRSATSRPWSYGRGLCKRIMAALTEDWSAGRTATAYVSLIADGPARFLYEKLGFADTAAHDSIGMYRVMGGGSGCSGSRA